MTKQNTPAIKKGDTVYIIGNLSEDLLALPEPRLGKVLTVNGAYIMVRPSVLNYDCEFLENEVRIAIAATPTEVKEPEAVSPLVMPYMLKEQIETVFMEADHNGWSLKDTLPEIVRLLTPKSSTPTTLLSEGKETEIYKHCNHHHELTDNHQIVNYGDGDFVANKAAIPLLKALNALGLRTRTHHIGDNGGFVSILLTDKVNIEVKQVYERDADRTKYNGLTELLINWNNE